MKKSDHPESSAPQCHPLRVLVVEDNFDTAKSTEMLLSQSGFDVQVAMSGADAIAVARNFAPQVVLCDIGLPGISGYDVARELRADAATKAARLIAISGYGQAEDRERSRAAGFDFHVTKPVDFDQIERLLAGDQFNPNFIALAR